MIKDRTRRTYESAQDNFAEWLADRGYALPADHSLIAAYLRTRLRRAPTTVPLHLSAIAHMYHRQHWPIDVSAPVLRRVKERAKQL